MHEHKDMLVNVIAGFVIAILLVVIGHMSHTEHEALQQHERAKTIDIDIWSNKIDDKHLNNKNNEDQ